MIYLFTTRIEEYHTYNHFFYDLEQKMFMSVIYDYYSFENIKLYVSYINNTNNQLLRDNTPQKLSIREDDVYIIDTKYGNAVNRLMMCESILMTKILDTL